MKIAVNGTQQHVTGTCLSDVLAELGFSGPALATALNGDFIAAGARADTELQDHDRLEVLAPMQGG